MTKSKSDPRYSPMPLSSFDPRYRELLLKGARERFLIPCGTPEKAHRFQMILCQFRKRLKEEFPDDPSQWEPLYACVVGKFSEDKSKLCLYPRHGEFDEILSAVKEPEAQQPKLSHDPLEDL